MDKKKVKELIEKAISELNTTDIDILSTQLTLEKALEELIKPDWISVKDGLPDEEEYVIVCNETNPDLVWFSYITEDCDKADSNGFRKILEYDTVTHWKPIGKLKD